MLGTHSNLNPCATLLVPDAFEEHQVGQTYRPLSQIRIIHITG